MIADDDEWGLATRSIRTGQRRTEESEHSEPVFLTSSFTFRNAAEAAARFADQAPGNIYTRFSNPNIRLFQDRLAALEGGESCIATGSGMSAILATCMALLRAGDHIVCSSSVFGSTVSLFVNVLSRFGIDTSFVSQTETAAWQAAIRPNTRMLFVETPSNPLMELADIQQLAAIAHAHDSLLVVDNCFCTPILQRPLSLGADIVVHSATKYLDGQGRCVGGAVVGDSERVGKEVFSFLRTAGPAMSPFNAWVFSKGLETLGLRMRAHCQNAQALAEWLQAQPQVEQVHYPGLPEHPQHALASRQQSDFGGMLSFQVAGGRDAAWALIDALRLVSITANLGDVKTTITHPATTTHGRISAEQRAAAGITEGLLRLSVGLEDVEDLQRDLAAGLQAA